MPLCEKKIVMVAGEASGDILAAQLAKKLYESNPELEISGIGGHEMQRSGVNIFNHLAEHGVTGIVEVFKHFKVIQKAFAQIKQELQKQKPDLLILIDYPGFNLRLARYAKNKLGIKILYYISPQIWAWKAGRIKLIKKTIDHMAVILPFEKNIYQKASVPVSFVGHPLVLTNKNDRALTRMSFDLPEHAHIIAIVPGSRTHEVEMLLPTMLKAMNNLCKKDKNIHILIPVAKTISMDKISALTKPYADLPITFITTLSKPIEAVKLCDSVVVASGTASLECALMCKPMCIVYKSAFITYLIATQLVKIRYLGLCNILADAMIVPELLQYDFTMSELEEVITKLIYNRKYANNIVERLQYLKKSLASDAADTTINNLALQMLHD